MSESHSINLKFCGKCNAETETYSNGQCKPCRVLSAAAYRALNPEKVKACNAAYVAKNREKKRKYNAEYHAANKTRIKASVTAYYEANKEKIAAYNAEYRAANRESRRVNHQNRRARVSENGGVLSKDLTRKLFLLQKGKCACCGLKLGEDYHLDHITPLALGGTNSDGNMQLLRARCNLQKHAKHPIDFMQERGFLL